MSNQFSQRGVMEGESIYERDFYLWTEVIANLLQEGRFEEVDIGSLIEEIESMGRSEKRELKSRLVVLLMHLLKWKYQPGKRSESWRSTISEQRICLEALLEDSPSLKQYLLDNFESCYDKARAKAADETGIRMDIFPISLPFTKEETLSSNYLPE